MAIARSTPADGYWRARLFELAQEQRTTRIDLPTTPRIKLFRWERTGSEIPDACAAVPEIASGNGG